MLASANWNLERERAQLQSVEVCCRHESAAVVCDLKCNGQSLQTMYPAHCLVHPLVLSGPGC